MTGAIGVSSLKTNVPPQVANNQVKIIDNKVKMNELEERIKQLEYKTKWSFKKAVEQKQVNGAEIQEGKLKIEADEFYVHTNDGYFSFSNFDLSTGVFTLNGITFDVSVLNIINFNPINLSSINVSINSQPFDDYIKGIIREVLREGIPDIP